MNATNRSETEEITAKRETLRFNMTDETLKLQEHLKLHDKGQHRKDPQHIKIEDVVMLSDPYSLETNTSRVAQMGGLKILLVMRTDGGLNLNTAQKGQLQLASSSSPC
jgi:hypothetical protein